MFRSLSAYLAASLLAAPALAQDPAAPARVPASAPVAQSTAAAGGHLPAWLTAPTSTEPVEATWSLDDVVAIALQNNPDLLSARANYEAASKVLEESYSGYLPSLDASAEYYRATLPSPSAGSTALLGLDRPYSDAMLNLSQTLFDFGKNLESIESARAAKSSVEQQYFALRNIVVLNTQRAFYDVAGNERLVGVAKQSLAQYQETYRRADLMVQTGVRPPFDRTQAEVERSKAELGLINAHNALDLSRIALLNLMGMTRQMKFSLKEDTGVPTIKAQALDLDHLTEVALSERPEMKRAAFDIAAVHDLVKQQRAGYFPTIDADAWYGSFLSDFPEALRHAHGYGLEASWNLFGGLSTTFRLRELEAREAEREAARDREAESIVSEVAAGYMNLLRAQESQLVADAALSYAQENFTYARLRYEANVGTILELLVAQSSLVDAQAGQVTARYRVATALASLRQAVNAPLAP